MAAENNQSDILSSWKEIAAYLNCGIRTCMRYEEKYGLPVYRLEEKPKTHVFAYKNELDEWLQNKQNKTEGTAKKSKHNWILYFFIPLFVIALFSIYIFFIKLDNPQPSDFKIEGSNLIVLDDKGDEIFHFDTEVENLWDEKNYRERYQYKRIINKARELPVLAIKDINGDNFNEVLFSIVTQDGFGGGKLFCFDHNGKELWKFVAGKELVYGEDVYSADYTIRGFVFFDLENDKNLEIAVNSNQIPDFPTQLVLLNSSGKRIGEYWNAGRFGDIECLDLDEDGKKEIVVAGMNNEYGKSFIAVFDSQNIQGGSPQKNEKYKCDKLERGTEKYYILLPRLDWTYKKNILESISQIDNLKNRRISFVTKVSRVIYEFGYDLKVLKIRPSHATEVMYNEALREGRIDFELNKQYVEYLANNILYYDGQNWVSTPTMNSYWEKSLIQ